MFIPFHSLLFELSKLNQALPKTKQLHALIIKTHLLYDPFYATKIIRLYSINYDLHSARKVFDKTPHRSVFLWNSIIRAFAQVHKFSDAYLLLKRMLNSETKPDNFTFACILRACCENYDLEGLRLVHGGLMVRGLGLDSICSSALVTAYSKLGLVDEASGVFNGIDGPDLVLWNSMISGYGCGGYWHKGLQLFSIMRRTGKLPDGYTMVGLISGLMDEGLLEIGQGIHCFCLKNGFDSNAHMGSALVSMYSRCKCMNSAHRVFNGLFQPDLVTWSALITGFSQCGEHKKALVFFTKMNTEGKKVDIVLIASMLAATAQLAVVEPGREMHGYAIRHERDSEVMVSSALTDMYAKCGFLGMAIRVFNTMLRRNIVTYNCMISSLGLYGLATEAFQMFREILEKGYKPDETTFSALLCACFHAGLVEDGREYFRRMNDEFEIQAKTEHYVYMVKLLGMSGELEEAYDLVQSSPKPVHSGIWEALLSCFDVHRNSEMAAIAAQQLLENKSEKITYKVMLSNMYAANGRWDDVKNVRDDITVGKRKLVGISWICSIK